jgi:hypothetical protein
VNRDALNRDALNRDSTVRTSRDGSSRGADRGWDDSGSTDRDDRGSRSGSRRSPGFDDSSDDLMTTSGKTGRTPPVRGARPEDFEERTVRLSSSSREHARPGQDRSSPGTREREATAASADRERRGNSGPHARPDSRKTSTTSSRRDDSLPDVKGRLSKSKSKRDDDSDLDWPSNEWDELSDVDYWTELAADKPFNAAATTQATTPPVKADRDRGKARSDTNPGAARSERREVSQRRDPAERRDTERTERRDSTERRDPTERRDQRDGLLPAARAPRQTVDAAFAPVTGDSVDAAFGGRTEAYGSTELRRSIAAGNETPRSRSSRHAPSNPAPSSPAPVPPSPVAPSPMPAGTGSRAVHPLDDDPLTSPSFPRVEADDSRSYRRGRSDRGTGSHSIPAAAETQQHSRPYPPMPAANGLDAQSASYTQPAVNGLDYAAAPAMPPVPAADPYRQHSVSPASESYPGRSASPDYAAASSDYPSSYSTPASVGAGYLPPVGGSYPGDAVTAAYSSRSATSGGYPVQPAQNQPAPSQLPPSQLPPSQLSPSSSPASSPGYSSSPGYPGDLDNGYSPAASYQSIPAQLPGYSGYPAASSGQHAAPPPAAPPTAEYSYPVSGDPGYPAPLPAATDYASYQPPVQADHANGYHSAVPSPATGAFGVDPVQPGYPSAPYNAPYQQAGYPAQGYESDASYPADPYAVDPYGHPGYGSARLPGRHHAADPVEQPIVYERYDGPAYAGPGYAQDQWSIQRWQDLSRDDEHWPERQGPDQYRPDQRRPEQHWHDQPRQPRSRVERLRDGYRPDGYR